MTANPRTDRRSALGGFGTEEYPLAQGDIIRDPQIISSLLRRIADQRALLRVTVPGFRSNYNSAILRMDPEQDLLILDELNPRKGHERLLEIRRLNASATVQGVETRFSGTLEEVGESSGIAFYRLPFPQEVLYVQRRTSFRVKVSMTAPVAAVFERGDGNALRGRILDLSEGGMGVEFSQSVSLQPGEIVPCQMRLPNGRQVGCKLEVRHCSASDDQARVRVGGRFVELHPQRRKVLSRLVADLQRELIRRQTRS